MSPWSGLFRERRFSLLFAARTVAMLGGSAAPVGLAFGILRLPGARPVDLSVVLATFGVFQLLFILLGGVLADRLSRYRQMVFAESVSALAWSAVAVLLMSQAPVWAIAVATAFAGAATALFYPALTGLVPEVVPAADLQTANAVLRMGLNVGRFGGFGLGGVSVQFVGPAWTVVICGSMFAFSAVLLSLLRLPGTSRSPGRNVMADLREGWREFSSRQWLWVVVLQFSFMLAALQAGFGVLGPVIAEAELGGAAAWSAILTGQGAGLLFGVMLTVRLRVRRPILVATLATTLYGVPLVLLGIGSPVWLIVIGAFVNGVGVDVFGVLWETTMQRCVPPAALSRVSSYDFLGSLALGPLGLIAAGPLTEAVGARTGALWCGLLIFASTAGALLSPDVRRLVWPADPPVTSAHEDLLRAG